MTFTFAFGFRPLGRSLRVSSRRRGSGRETTFCLHLIQDRQGFAALDCSRRKTSAGSYPGTSHGLLTDSSVQHFARDLPPHGLAIAEDVSLAVGFELDDVVFTYSDFSYLEVWIMATWTMSAHFSFDLIANYQPENHTEQDDDIALGFGTARLVWRP